MIDYVNHLVSLLMRRLYEVAPGLATLPNRELVLNLLEPFLISTVDEQPDLRAQGKMKPSQSKHTGEKKVHDGMELERAMSKRAEIGLDAMQRVARVAADAAAKASDAGKFAAGDAGTAAILEQLLRVSVKTTVLRAFHERLPPVERQELAKDAIRSAGGARDCWAERVAPASDGGWGRDEIDAGLSWLERERQHHLGAAGVELISASSASGLLEGTALPTEQRSRLGTAALALAPVRASEGRWSLLVLRRADPVICEHIEFATPGTAAEGATGASEGATGASSLPSATEAGAAARSLAGRLLAHFAPPPAAPPCCATVTMAGCDDEPSAVSVLRAADTLQRSEAPVRAPPRCGQPHEWRLAHALPSLDGKQRPIVETARSICAAHGHNKVELWWRLLAMAHAANTTRSIDCAPFLLGTKDHTKERLYPGTPPGSDATAAPAEAETLAAVWWKDGIDAIIPSVLGDQERRRKWAGGGRRGKDKDASTGTDRHQCLPLFTDAGHVNPSLGGFKPAGNEPPRLAHSLLRGLHDRREALAAAAELGPRALLSELKLVPGGGGLHSAGALRYLEATGLIGATRGHEPVDDVLQPYLSGGDGSGLAVSFAHALYLGDPLSAAVQSRAYRTDARVRAVLARLKQRLEAPTQAGGRTVLAESLHAAALECPTLAPYADLVAFVGDTHLTGGALEVMLCDGVYRAFRKAELLTERPNLHPFDTATVPSGGQASKLRAVAVWDGEGKVLLYDVAAAFQQLRAARGGGGGVAQDFDELMTRVALTPFGANPVTA